MRERRQPEFITPETSELIENYLRNLSKRLAELQAADGSWGLDWTDPPASSYEEFGAHQDDYDRFCITGHFLEWMAIVTPDLRPRDEVVTEAANYIVRELRANEALLLRDQTAPVTHAVRAILNLASPSENRFEVRSAS